MVTLLLNAADDKVQDFIAIKDKNGYTALDIAKPKVKEIILQYLPQ